MNLRRAAFTVGVVSLFCAAQAGAAVVYDNGFTEHHGGFLSDLSLSSFLGGTQHTADNFSLAAPATLRHVEWEGFYFLGGEFPPPASDNFIVRIYAESSGLPSALLYEDVVGNVSRTLIGGFAGGEFTYSADIAPIHLAGGINYFLSIVNNTVDDDDAWLWAVSALNSGQAWFAPGGTDDWFTAIGDLAFRLSDRRHLPEPTTLALLGIGLAGLAFSRRKRAA